MDAKLYRKNIPFGKYGYIADAITILKKENFDICDHDIINYRIKNHPIEGK
jgi:hypothetical protein